MRARLRSWWQKVRTPLFGFGAFVASALVIVLLVVEVRLYGTGFAGKTLFDWLNLIGVLAVPVVVGFGVAWITRTQQLRDQQLADQRAETERSIAQDNQRDAALQAYLDKMSELLLKEHLGELLPDGKADQKYRQEQNGNIKDELKPEYEAVRNIARVRTITILTQLDARRVGYVFAFLREARLMSTTPDDNVLSLVAADLSAVKWSQADLGGTNLCGTYLYQADLRDANLSGANLSGANLSGANLSGAFLSQTTLCETNLSNANLTGTYLGGTDLSGANLSNANFRAAYLSGASFYQPNISNTNPNGDYLYLADLSNANLCNANLNEAKVTEEQLKKALSLTGATMPDGKIYS